MDEQLAVDSSRALIPHTSSSPHHKGAPYSEFEVDHQYDFSNQLSVNTDTISFRSARFKGSWWARVWHNTVDDVYNAPWRWTFRRFFSHFIPLLCVVFFIIAATGGSAIADVVSGDVCLADGTFMYGSSTPYSLWHWNRTFSIDFIATENLSFGNAKLVDVIWDIAAGRGGQFVMATFAYQIFSRALVRSMETSTVSQETFKALILKETTISGVWSMILHFFTNKGLRARLTAFWVILAAVFVLATPTWISAMTGYTAALSPFVIDSQQNFIAIQGFLPVVYLIHDGERVGLTKDAPVTVSWGTFDPTYRGSALTSGLYEQFFNRPSGIYGCNNGGDYNQTELSSKGAQPHANTSDPCAWMWRVSQYVSTYGFLGRNSTNSTFFHPNGTVLNFATPQSSLNISATFYNDSSNLTSQPWYVWPVGFNFQEATDGPYIFRTNNPLYYYSASTTLYKLGQLNFNGTCQPSTNEYQWGFSFLLTYSYVVAIAVWLVIMWAIYLDAYSNSRLDANGRILGLERGVLDLSTAMQKKLDTKETEFYGNSKIRQLLRQTTVTYSHLSFEVLRPSRRVQLSMWWKSFSFKTWLWAEKWWLAALIVFTIMCGLSYDFDLSISLGWSPVVSPLPMIGVMIVITMGGGSRSRWLVFAFFFTVFVIVDIAMASLITT